MKVSLDSTNLPSPTIDVDIMMKKREYTRGLLLCNHRIYIQSLQVIASIADQTYKDISKECEGSLSFNNLWCLPEKSDESNDCNFQSISESTLITDWTSHLSTKHPNLNITKFLDLQS